MKIGVIVVTVLALYGPYLIAGEHEVHRRQERSVHILPVNKTQLSAGKYKITDFKDMVTGITFSGSSNADPNYRGPNEAKWNGKAWVPKHESQDPTPTLTVTFDEKTTLCGVVTSGREDWKDDFVKKFTIEYQQDDNSTFWPAYNYDGSQIFDGPDDGTKYNTQGFYFSISAKVVKIMVKQTGVLGAAAAIRVGFLKDCTYNPAPRIINIGCHLQMRDGAYDFVSKCDPIIFKCPSGLKCKVLDRIWGNPNVYTDDSPICKAAVHSLGSIGGPVVATKLGPKSLFMMAYRNGILSSMYTKPWEAYGFSIKSIEDTCRKQEP